MKNLKLLNNLIFQLFLTIIFSIKLYATEPIDIWKGHSESVTESAETTQIKIDDAKKPLSGKKEITSSTIFQENEKNLDFDRVYGIFDPAENNLSMELWTQSDGKTVLEHLKRIEKINLSKDSEELLIKILFTNSYLPIKNINSSDFLDYKLDWLIKKNKINIIEDFLEKNPFISSSSIILNDPDSVWIDECGVTPGYFCLQKPVRVDRDLIDKLKQISVDRGHQNMRLCLHSRDQCFRVVSECPTCHNANRRKSLVQCPRRTHVVVLTC